MEYRKLEESIGYIFKDESLLKNPNIWELSIEKRLIVYSFTNKSIVIIDDKKRVFPCDLKHIFDSCDEFDVNITSCNESDLSRVMNTSAYRTIEKKFYDYNAIPLEFNTKKHLLYLGYPNKDEYIEKVMFKNLENLKFKMLDINNILMINVHTDKYLINKYIKTWIKYYNEEKEVFDKETKKRCVNVSILKLENKKLTNSDIWCKYHTKQEQHELDIAKKSKDADDKRFCAKVRKWTTNEFKRASQIPPPDGLPPWPSKWDRDEREELLDKLAQIYGVKRNS